jgi:hypothetical protein
LKSLSKTDIGSVLVLIGGASLIALTMYAADIRQELVEAASLIQTAFVTKGSGEFLWEDQFVRGIATDFLLIAAGLCLYLSAVAATFRGKRRPGGRGENP